VCAEGEEPAWLAETSWGGALPRSSGEPVCDLWGPRRGLPCGTAAL